MSDSDVSSSNSARGVTQCGESVARECVLSSWLCPCQPQTPPGRFSKCLPGKPSHQTAKPPHWTPANPPMWATSLELGWWLGQTECACPTTRIVKRPGPWCGLQGSGAQIRHSRGLLVIKHTPGFSLRRNHWCEISFQCVQQLAVWLIVPLGCKSQHTTRPRVCSFDTPTNHIGVPQSSQHRRVDHKRQRSLLIDLGGLPFLTGTQTKPLRGRVPSQNWPLRTAKTAGSSAATPVLLSSTDVTPWPLLEAVQQPTPLANPSAGPPSTLAFPRRNEEQNLPGDTAAWGRDPSKSCPYPPLW